MGICKVRIAEVAEGVAEEVEEVSEELDSKEEGNRVPASRPLLHLLKVPVMVHWISLLRVELLPRASRAQMASNKLEKQQQSQSRRNQLARLRLDLQILLL